MKRVFGILILCLFWSFQNVWAESSSPRVQLKTNHGIIVLELNPNAAPKTVENFMRYVQSGFYNNTIFHRVIKGFMIQGGGFSATMKGKPTFNPILNEADNGLENQRGTVAMARTNMPHSATSQFFINTVNNPFLNHKGKSPNGWGYCVFGKVIEGMDVVDSIEKVPTGSNAGHQNVPVSPVVIEKAEEIK